MIKHFLAAALLLAATATASAQTTVMPLGGGFYTYGGPSGSGMVAPLGGGAYSIMPLPASPTPQMQAPTYGNGMLGPSPNYGVPSIGYRR